MAAIDKLGSWTDVQKKGHRLYATNKVHPTEVNGYGIICTVEGDHGTYETIIVNEKHSKDYEWWSCECLWGFWAWKRQDKYRGRPCSHALAVGRMWSLSGVRGKDKDSVDVDDLQHRWAKIFKPDSPIKVNPQLDTPAPGPMPEKPGDEEVGPQATSDEGTKIHPTEIKPNRQQRRHQNQNNDNRQNWYSPVIRRKRSMVDGKFVSLLVVESEGSLGGENCEVKDCKKF